MGKNLMEEQVLLSAQEFLAHMASIKNKEEIDLRTPIQASILTHIRLIIFLFARLICMYNFAVFVANIINKTLFGFSYEYARSDRLMASVDVIVRIFDEMKGSKLTMLAQVFTFIHRLPVIGYYSKGRFERMIEEVKKNITEDVERCLKTYDPDQEPECFVHAYYQKMQTNPNLNYDNLLNVCMDFFLAGMETTTTTLRWGTLFMAKHPNVQDKIRQEIFSVLGADGRPSTSLRNRMPYTNAAIQEIQRYANIIPLNVIHRTVKDTSVESVPIPGDTLHVMAHSPVYKDAQEFRPERFLMDDGITPNKEAVEQLCPFSVGKRQCAGEGLAKVELFIGLITLLQNYKIEPVRGRPLDLEPIFASVLLPKQQPLRLTPVSV
ncbi:unspecific monooxygenase [Ancylostoma duodenale]|uniref:Unspecific monooxygenase n=1 Tax=Ancylostoma duodenale TaxID=51022 RepID=A0A0C2G4Q6_9BILA|nr:unspecific monooxygenase [Ancylostoma duodenale]